MDRSSPSSPPDAATAARRVVDRLRDSGYTALFAGGCVRDRLLGYEPSDYDVATDADPEVVQKLFRRTAPVGASFGVVLVIIDGRPVEVARFRTDDEYVDGRHPVAVRPATPQEDAQRRDFTINGMFFDPITGAVIDYVGGRADLEAGVVRAIGDPVARFREDHLRMLRAVRIAARLGFEIAAATMDAITDNATALDAIALERVGEEVIRILTEGSARRGFELLDRSGLLPVILPEVSAMKGVEQSPDYHPEGDVFEHTLRLLERLEKPTETLALGALLHDVSKAECAGRAGDRITFYGHPEVGEKRAIEICQRLRRSKFVWERVGYLVRNHLRHVSAPEMRRSTLRRFLSEDGIEELLELARLDALASNGDLRSYEFCVLQRAAIGVEQLRPPPLLRGRDLLDLGWQPGPLFGAILAAVEERQLEGELTSREEALTWVEREYGADHGRGVVP
jgi:poly(A) polymerase